MESVYEETYKGYTVKIVPDNDSDNPRNWDNAGKMVCWHSRYDLGDEQPKEDPITYLCGILGLDGDDFSQNRTSLNILMGKMEKDYIVLPLYLYDHSGISISTGSFIGRAQHAEWDSGEVGFIFISNKDAVKEWGKKHFTKTVETKAVKCLKGEVETYNDYLVGNVYGYQVCDEDGEVLDSCYGYYPDHDGKSYYAFCLQEAKSMVDRMVKEVDNKKWEDAQTLELAV